MNHKSVLIVAALVSLSGCASSDRLLRPEHVTYMPWEANPTPITIVNAGNLQLQLKCLDKRNGFDSSEPVSDANRCLYYAVDEREIFKNFGQSKLSATELEAMRNSHVSFLLNLSEHNCTTFLNRAFASKSGVDTSSRTFNDILTGLSAATANAEPHAAAGLSVANLIIGKTVDNINSTYYFEKTFQALAASIHAERGELKVVLNKNLATSITQFTIYDALSAVHRYDNACSIRVGLEKLQGIAQDAASKNATIASKTETIERKEKELVEKNAEIKSLTDKLLATADTIRTGQNSPLAQSLDKLLQAKNDSERRFIIAKMNGILQSHQESLDSFESLASTLRNSAFSPKEAGRPANTTE